MSFIRDMSYFKHINNIYTFTKLLEWIIKRKSMYANTLKKICANMEINANFCIRFKKMYNQPNLKRYKKKYKIRIRIKIILIIITTRTRHKNIL
jgi:hypothetical protein